MHRIFILHNLIAEYTRNCNVASDLWLWDVLGVRISIYGVEFVIWYRWVGISCMEAGQGGGEHRRKEQSNQSNKQSNAQIVSKRHIVIIIMRSFLSLGEGEGVSRYMSHDIHI